MRFEDTDPRISFSEYRESLFRTLHRLGFEEELEVMNQGERHHIYNRAALELVRLGKAYPCFCTRDELIHRLKNKGFTSSGEMVRYDGFCRNLTTDDIATRLSAGLRPAYRLKVDPQIIFIEDIIKGQVRFNTGLMGDFIILRNDGTGLYNFACVVDDILTGVTHVIRGEDHLVNTPKQMLIYQALEAPPPQFAHIPLFLGNRGEKYSKRTASLSVFQLLQQGFLPEAILNYNFYAGRKNVNEKPLLTADEMIEQFDLSKISPSYCRFDMRQLKYFNRQAIKKRSNESIEGEILDFLDAKGLLKERPEPGKLEALRGLLPDMRKRTADMVELSLSYYALLRNIIEETETPVEKSGLESFSCGTQRIENPSCRETAIETSPIQAAFPSLVEFPIQATFPSIEEFPVQATFLSLEKAKPFVLAEEDHGREAHPSENRDQLSSIKKFILTHRKRYGKLARQAITGDTNGIPLEALLSLPDSFLHQKLGKLLDSPEEGTVPTVFTLKKHEIEENRIRHYFRKLLGFNVEKIEKLRGLRNNSFRVDCREGSFVFKRALTGDFSSLHYEKEVMLRLGEEGLSPRSPLMDLSGEFFDEPVLVYVWLWGRVPETIEPSLYKGIAEYLCRIHTVVIPSLPFMSTDSLGNYFDEFMENFRNYMELRTLEGLGEDDFTESLNKYISIIDDQLTKYNDYWQPEFPLSLLHGDLRPSNLVVAEADTNTDANTDANTGTNTGTNADTNTEANTVEDLYGSRPSEENLHRIHPGSSVLPPGSSVLQNGDLKISAIDWEEARLGDPAFEVSWFFRTNNFTEQQEREFLGIYLNLYQNTFPGDKYIAERIEGYNLVNHLNFPLGSAIHCMKLGRGIENISLPIPYYVRREAESLKRGFIEAFKRVDAITYKNRKNNKMEGEKGERAFDFTQDDGKGRIFLVPPELPENSIIVIDGVSSSGKSIIAPEIAGRMDLLYINLGAFFRAVVFELNRQGIMPDNPHIDNEIKKIHIDYQYIKIPPFLRISINTKDVSPYLYTAETETKVPLYSGNRFLIDFIKDKIKAINKTTKGTIVEGHKAGIEFFPEAQFKFFLYLEDKERAKLKKDQLTDSDSESETPDEETVSEMLNARDRLDFSGLPEERLKLYNIINMETLDVGKAVREIFDKISGILL